MPALPRVFGQQGRAGREVGERRGVGRGSLGPPAGDQVELGQLLTFISRRDQRRAAVELIDYLEDRLVPLSRRRPRRQQPADPQVRLGAQVFRDQRIGGFLDAVMEKPVVTV